MAARTQQAGKWVIRLDVKCTGRNDCLHADWLARQCNMAWSAAAGEAPSGAELTAARRRPHDSAGAGGPPVLPQHLRIPWGQWLAPGLRAACVCCLYYYAGTSCHPRCILLPTRLLLTALHPWFADNVNKRAVMGYICCHHCAQSTQPSRQSVPDSTPT